MQGQKRFLNTEALNKEKTTAEAEKTTAGEAFIKNATADELPKPAETAAKQAPPP